MPPELILTNARVVTPERALHGSLLAREGRIVDISPGPSRAPGAVDCEGDWLIPGLVELHTDNLERHLRPRPGVLWPRRAAVAAHDGEFVSCGVTTVLDALRVGVLPYENAQGDAVETAEAVREMRANGLLKADHLLHLRCEVCAPDLAEAFDAVAGSPLTRLVSVMDHTFGQRQFRREEVVRAYYVETRRLSEEELQALLAQSRDLQRRYAGPNRAALALRLERLRAGGAEIAVASHDDAEPEHVAENLALGARLAEFPTTMQAARLSRESGMAVLMGAPNLLRGFSHSGNLSAMALAEAGMLDVLSSDYAPASLLQAAFKLGEETDFGLPQAIRTVTKAPAEAVGLTDRGALEPGRLADLARVRRAEGVAVARAAWRAGARIM